MENEQSEIIRGHETNKINMKGLREITVLRHKNRTTNNKTEPSILLDEIEEAMTLKNGKAAGPAEVP